MTATVRGPDYGVRMYLENLVIDALYPQRLGRFWEEALGTERLTDVPEGFETRLDLDGGWYLDLCFQRVPEPASEPPRLHVDLLGGPAQADVVERLLALGARHLDIGQGDAPWVVLADPEGNPCCVMEHREEYAGTGPIAALPLDSADPDRDAEFWAWLTGWTDVPATAPRALRHPSRTGPLLELCPEARPKGAAKIRWHLDVRLEAGEDADAVEADVLARGGRRVDTSAWGDLPWRTYLDPSGNEFCVLSVPGAEQA
ncbi:VOC family protein [Nocardioides aquiterrae]|uniref:VOC family protein n=2 Tax=Nocardioides aquiterrae TaxID=203799 RepID=A0ABN1UA83_9ACTN